MEEKYLEEGMYFSNVCKGITWTRDSPVCVLPQAFRVAVDLVESFGSDTRGSQTYNFDTVT